jgi:hypothetical protein
VAEVKLASEYRLEAVLFSRTREFGNAVQVTVVGNRDGGHSMLGRFRKEMVDPRCPVKERIMRVAVQMTEFRHQKSPLQSNLSSML